MRVLAFAISFFWTTAFALLALAAAGMIPSGPDRMAIIVATGGQAPALAVGFLLVSAAFLWAFVTVLFDEGGVKGDVDWVFRIAAASGVLLTTIVLLLLAPRQPIEAMTAALFAIALLLAPRQPIEAMTAALFAIAALAASMSAVDAERRALERTESRDEVDAVAGLMAAGAAHNTMLSVISQRRYPGREED
jgi:hypothetical protein